MSLKLQGGCYCKQIRYSAEGEPISKIQCHCRECMYITGGSPTEILTMPAAGFKFTQGEPKSFTRTDIPNAVTRVFCSNCGTHMLSQVPQMPHGVLLKIGALDDPSVFGAPQIALFVREKLAFHHIPEGTLAFDSIPGR